MKMVKSNFLKLDFKCCKIQSNNVRSTLVCCFWMKMCPKFMGSIDTGYVDSFVKCTKIILRTLLN
jgi:hypothetical protein